VTCGLLAGAQTLIAHHAGTMFDENKTSELTGTIKEFQFTNPHSWIQVMVQTKPGEAPKEWSIEWGSPNQLSRQGIRPSTFNGGHEGRHARAPDARWLGRRQLRRREIRGWQSRRPLGVVLVPASCTRH
jgi:hypothetical protein